MQEIAVSAVDLDDIETGGNGALDGSDIGRFELLYVGFRHRLGMGKIVTVGHGARRVDVVRPSVELSSSG